MKTSLKLLLPVCFGLMLTSCDELEDSLTVSLQPTFEESMSIDFPDSTRPGEIQTMYMLFTRKIDLGGEQAPTELRGNVESMVNLELSELYLKIEGVNGEPTIPKRFEGYISFFPGETFDEKAFPSDTFDPTSFPGDAFDPDADLGVNFDRTEILREQLEFTYVGSGGGTGKADFIILENGEGEGKYLINLSEETVQILENRLLDDGGIGIGLAIEFNGDMPFSADFILGMQFDLDVSL